MRQLVVPSHVADPHPVYEAIRAGTAVQLPTGELAFARYSDVATIAKDPRFGKPPQPNFPFGPARTLFRMPLLVDPPDHTRLRRVVVPRFLPAATAEWTDTIMKRSEQLLPPNETQIDIVSDYSHELPFAVISTMLAVPDEDRDELARWSRTLTEAVDAPPPANIRDIGRAVRLIATRRTKPIHAIRSSAKIVRYAKHRLDLTRPATPPHLGFGGGIHFMSWFGARAHRDAHCASCTRATFGELTASRDMGTQRIPARTRTSGRPAEPAHQTCHVSHPLRRDGAAKENSNSRPALTSEPAPSAVLPAKPHVVHEREAQTYLLW